MISEFYYPFIGGAEQHVRSLSRELVARGHDVAVVTLWHTGLAEFEIDHGVRIYRVRGTLQRPAAIFNDQARRYVPPFPDPEALLAIREVIARERPAIVHAHNWLVHSFLPIKAWSRARLVMTLHDYSLACVKKTLMRDEGICDGPGLAKCLACASGYYGAAKAVPTVLANYGMSRAERAAVDMFLPVSHAVAAGSGLVDSRLRYRVIPNFVRDDIAQVPAAHDPLLAQLPDRDYMLFVGALGRHKGLHVLLEAYAGLRDAPPLVLIGAPLPDTPAAVPWGVVLLKSWPNTAVMQAWRRCLFGLVPSVWPEPCGIVVLEAMAASRPVIASRIGGLTDLVADGETGLVVAPGDALALRGAMARLLNEGGLRATMGQAARRRLVEFQASTIVPRIERVYESLIVREPSTTRHTPVSSG
jgi:glycosyltransferase involved in cell wall biosynthesis